MNKLLLFTFVVTFCLIGITSAATGCLSSRTYVNSIPAVGSKFSIQTTNDYEYQFEYYTTTNNKVEVSASLCSSIANDLNVAYASFDLIPATDNSGVTFSISKKSPTTPPTTPPSTTPAEVETTAAPSSTAEPPKTVDPNAAGRLNISPLVTLLSLCLACVFVFPKQRFSLFVVFVVFALAFWAPASQAASASNVVITIRVGIPTSFTNLCTNDVCIDTSFPYVVAFGRAYSTIDQSKGCTNNQLMTMPAGWTLATVSDDSKLVIQFNKWAASYIILDDNAAYVNNAYDDNTGPGGMMVISGNQYSVPDCSSYKILISSPSSSSFAFSPAYTLISSPSTITSFVTFNGKDYGVGDNTPFGTTTRSSQTNAVYVQSSDAWQVATFSTTSGASKVAISSQVNSFGATCIAVQDGSSYNSFNASNPTVSCGSSDVIAAAYGSGTVYTIKPSASYTTKLLFSRTTTAPLPRDSWNNNPVISNSYTIGTGSNAKWYATLDNADSSVTDTGCQNRPYAVPQGWAFASDTELAALVTNLQANPTIWAGTTCFANAGKSMSRSDASTGCAGPLVQSVGLSKFYYSYAGCSRMVIVRSPPANNFNIGMRVALISKTNDASEPVYVLASTMLTARGIPFDWLPVTDATSGTSFYPTTLPLVAAGSPVYYAIVFTDSLDLSLASNTALKTQMVSYKFNYDVRIVSLNAYPDLSQGVSAIASKNANYSFMYIDSTFAAANKEYVDGIVPTAEFALGGMQVILGQTFDGSYYVAANPGWNAVPFLRATDDMTANKNSTTDDIIATLVTSTDSTEELQFYIAFSRLSYVGPVISNVWINWVTRGVYLGYRRVYLNAQIDDLLLGTEQYKNNADPKRMEASDMTLTADYINGELKNSLPAGSHVTLTWAVNGWGQNNVTGGQVDTIVVDPTKANDPLADACLAHYEDFFWESHTWSHKDFTCQPEFNPDAPGASCLANTSIILVKSELKNNNDYFNTMLFATKGGINGPNFAKSCLVTPAITGLFNPSALEGLVSEGFTCVVGDNSVTKLIQAKPYSGQNTTVEYNGREGIFIIPRWPTEVYYNTFNPFYLEKQYNERYGPAGTSPYFSKDLTTDDIMEREANTNFWHLSELRHDPFMFHQCNCMFWPYTAPGDTVQKQWSLVNLWLRAVTKKYMQYMTLPLLSSTQNDLQDLYFARNARDSCNQQATININNNKMNGISIKGDFSCTPVITGLDSCGSLASGVCRAEQYGEDDTLYVTVPGGSTAVNVPATVPW